MTIHLVHGTLYTADVVLGFFEAVAGNGTISDKLTAAGFEGVVASGSGRKRVVSGTWGGATGDYDLPDQVRNVR